MKHSDDSKKTTLQLHDISLPVHQVHTLVIGSGAAALKAANRLHQHGVTSLVIVTEGVHAGTSYNTGSDKQTYYRLSTNEKEPDSPYLMASDLYSGGAMHGDTALVESLLSAESFFYLASLGVPFPINRYGGYVGYKTDHDSRERGCSIGPYTSKKMVEVLLAEVYRRGITIHEGTEIISLLTSDSRVVGAVGIDRETIESETYGLCLYMAENVVFGVGGPGGIYEDSVYPAIHVGAIGLALEVGAEANNLTESQFGLASTKFRWNVSGSYQQVIPSYFSTDSEGNDRQEFLQPFFSSTESLCNAIFLKGYQWPFDVNKILDEGSSLIDILVYRERVLLGRRVYMDFRVNPQAVPGSAPFSLMGAGEVAYSYLEKSGALGETPYERLKQMNPQAIELYRSNGIDLANEPLEVAVCSQHNNGGLSVDIWWESTNISHLFPVGEVAGTHGVVRPGGSALNSGQVGGERAAQKIAGVYQEHTVEWETFMAVAKSQASKLYALAKAAIKKESLSDEDLSLVAYQKEFRSRMSRSGSMIRSTERIADELIAAQEQVAAFEQVRIKTRYSLPRFFAARHLALTHLVYLEAIAEYLKQAFGSRGSALILQEDGKAIHPKLDSFWRFTPENTEGRAESITTIYQGGESMHGRVACRPIPDEEYWFETVWRDFLAGKHFNDYGEKAQKS